jgi:hypothetical protein
MAALAALAAVVAGAGCLTWAALTTLRRRS